jgi:protein-S-isoprenylcysteine O-methyltransferase Ste14
MPSAILVVVVPGAFRFDVVLSLLLLTLWSTLEIFAENFASNAKAIGSTQDRGSRQLMLWTHMLCWWAPLIELAFHSTVRSIPRLVCGVAILCAGAAIRVAAVRELGACFTGYVYVAKAQAVKHSGLYRFVRHPGYVGLTLINAGPAVATGTWSALVVGMTCTFIANFYRVRVEEFQLKNTLGAAYSAYCSVTPRWLPRIRRARMALADQQTERQ